MQSSITFLQSLSIVTDWLDVVESQAETIFCLDTRPYGLIDWSIITDDGDGMQKTTELRWCEILLTGQTRLRSEVLHEVTPLLCRHEEGGYHARLAPSQTLLMQSREIQRLSVVHHALC